jgi:hypothetical protein
MTTYRVTAPMVLLKVKGNAGQPQVNSFYAGAIVPVSAAEVDPKNLARHVDRGWVEEVDDVPAEPVAPASVPSRGSGGGVPEGTADKVLEWVGEDKERAAQALVAEQKRDKPRSTLVDQLTKTAGLAG